MPPPAMAPRGAVAGHLFGSRFWAYWLRGRTPVYLLSGNMSAQGNGTRITLRFGLRLGPAILVPAGSTLSSLLVVASVVTAISARDGSRWDARLRPILFAAAIAAIGIAVLRSRPAPDRGHPAVGYLVDLLDAAIVQGY